MYYHLRKWSRDGSPEQVWQRSIRTIQGSLDLSEPNPDGSHATAKKGVESVIYQGRKQAKKTNILPITDAQDYISASTTLLAGHHYDAFQLEEHLQAAFRFMKRLGLVFQGAYFNADSAFEARAAHKVCFNHGVILNIAENQRNRNGCLIPRSTDVALPPSVLLPG